MDVSNLRVLVTAGASGIGREIAAGFHASGAQVHITDIDAAALTATVADLAGTGGTAAEAADPAQVDRVLAEVTERFGGLDVLVNNVGIAGPTGGIDSYADAEVGRTIEVNLTSHFYFLNRFVPLLRRSAGSASVIEIGSVAGRLGYPFRSPYAATKWAIVGLMKSLAAEIGPLGIRVNAILPGVVEGPRMDRVIADRAAALGADIAATREGYLNKISLRRMVEAEDIASLALFLSSGLARNITGQAISVDGNVEYL
jgi:NAD(P)-dependent dehydrogenase (short-subunit alcohol dehydrogenase family)